MRTKHSFFCWMAWLLVLLLAVPPGILAESTEGSKTFKQEELDQMLAPIALYPDSLLSQIFMASTYPLEVVHADRWVKQHKDLKGDALTAALEKEEWDPSVKSLVNFPDVLTKMGENLEWTQKMGDAFLAQQEDVMDTVQNLRAKAQEQGNLETTKEQKVVVEEKIIIIESASPEVIYVPAYNPVVVYGSWWWPHYRPLIFFPPPPGLFLGFGMGFAMGAAWGYAWGHCSWRHGSVNINVNKNININKNINRNAYAKKYQAKGQLDRNGRGTWQHDQSHRKGVSYRDDRTAQKFNRGTSSDAARSRESFRGRADQGRQDLSRGGGDRTSGRAGDRSSVNRGGRESAFGGGQRGSEVKRQSNRGRSSHQSMGSRGGSRGGGGRGGGGRSGGGRGGGGGRR